MKKARVLLISPNLISKGGENRVQPSLGLMIIGQMLLDDGHVVKIHDTALEGWDNKNIIDPKNNSITIGQSDEEIKKFISDFSPDIVGMSVLFSNFLKGAHCIARLAKEVDKNIKVVLGGNHISNSVSDYSYGLINKDSNLPNFINDLEDDNIDFALTGEGETPMVTLTNAIINNYDVSKIPGLVKKFGHKKYFINSKNENHDVDSLPRPARYLVNMDGYFKIGAFHSPKSRSNRVLSVMCSRGCPEKCTFCTTPKMWGHNVRWRSTKHIMNEIINDVKDFKIGEIQFEDDTITVNKKNLDSLCAELEKVGLPWCTPNGTKVNYHLKNQSEMYKKMAGSGCYQITLACESGVQRVLDKVINKRLLADTIYPSVENAKKAGMLCHTFWILGFPGETYEEIQATIDFAMNSGADSFSFGILCPLPGASIYRKAMKENLWWENKSIENLDLRSSLLKVNGFNGPEEFEKFVSDINIRANLLLKENDSKRFKLKYGDNKDYDFSPHLN